MIITRLAVGFLGTNCYILNMPYRNDAVLIDPGDNYTKIKAMLDSKGLTAKALLLTHAQFDHTNAVAQFARDGAKVYLHHLDVHMSRNDFGISGSMGVRFCPFDVDVVLNDGDLINECGMTFKVMHTPGHTAGGVCYLSERIIFSGDTLFFMSVGRTDLPTGNGRDLFNSLKKLFALDGDYDVYPGHGDKTTLFFEKNNNPYV